MGPATRPPETLIADRAREDGVGLPRRRGRGAVPQHPLPGAGRPRQPRRDQRRRAGSADRRAHRRRARAHGGLGPRPTARDPVRVNLLLRESSTRSPAAPPRARTWTRGPPRAARAVRVLADRARPRVARRRHRRRSCAAACPGLRDRVARAGAGHPGAARARRGDPPRQRRAGQRGGAHRPRGGDHDLHAFQAMRRMDEILVANFMLFDDVVSEDGATTLDRRRGVGDRPLPAREPRAEARALRVADRFRRLPADAAGGEREAFLTADYNAEMIEHVARFPRVRDRAIFVGDPDDIVPRRSAPACRRSASGRERHYRFGATSPASTPRARPTGPRCAPSSATADEPVCLVAVGGSGVGAPLLRRVVEAAAARARARARAAHGRGRRAAHRSGEPAARRRASRCAATSTSCTATRPPATSGSSRAG